jgi:hypothetical protein
LRHLLVPAGALQFRRIFNEGGADWWIGTLLLL